MSLKILVLLLSAVIFLFDSCSAQNFVDDSGVDERTMYGWSVKIVSSELSIDKSCYGIFIGPRVFLTQSQCVENSGMFSNIQIINDIFNSDITKTEFTISHNNVYTNRNLKKGKIVFDRKVALLVTDEPVIPADENTDKSFIKLAENINDVDLTTCFIPEVPAPPIIVKSVCQSMDFNLNDESIDEFPCDHDPKGAWYGNGLVCHLKSNPDVRVLTGYVGSDYDHDLAYFKTPQTVINLSGLNIGVMKI